MMQQFPFRRLLLIGGVLLASITTAGLANAEPVTLELWPNGAPGAKGDAPNDKPQLIIYQADAKTATGGGVVVLPGGGYGHLAMGHEGHDIAKWFNSMGVSAFICSYRHKGKGYGHPAPMNDAHRAIQYVRANAKKYGVDPQKVGVIGFSAGGHLASTVATHFDKGDKDAKDPVARVSNRPDFAILCYAVIAFDEPFTHRGSQRNLLGADAPAELIKKFSNEKQVTAETPPCFLWHTREDKGVPAKNSEVFYAAMQKAGVKGELHIYDKGRHGLGLAKNVEGASKWPAACQAWLHSLGVATKPAAAE